MAIQGTCMHGLDLLISKAVSVSLELCSISMCFWHQLCPLTWVGELFYMIIWDGELLVTLRTLSETCNEYPYRALWPSWLQTIQHANMKVGRPNPVEDLLKLHILCKVSLSDLHGGLLVDSDHLNINTPLTTVSTGLTRYDLIALFQSYPSNLVG